MAQSLAEAGGAVAEARVIGVGVTLGRYLSMRFVSAILAVFGTVFVLVYMLDFVELMRRAGDAPQATAGTMAKLALYRTPSVAEQVMPFAVLFGSMLTFLTLSRRLELVVVRAAGVSVWGFLRPALIVAVLAGLATAMLFNPLSAHLRQRAAEIESRLFVRASRAGDDVYFRQRNGDGQGIIRASAVADEGRTLLGATFFLFDAQGGFRERVEAKKATLRDDSRWEMTDARVIRVGVAPTTQATVSIATNLRPDIVRQATSSQRAISFWRLLDEARNAEEAGLDATRYRLQFQSLLALPLLFAAMVIIASTVSLRFFRMGGIARMVLSGVAAGFVLYVTKKLVEDLGASGILSISVAAWSTAVVGCLVGVLALLHLEDG